LKTGDNIAKGLQVSRQGGGAVSRSAPYRILVVDDEEPIRVFVGRVLRQLDCDIATAADGSEAIAIAEAQGPFDLLVTDMLMPGIPGDELARRLRLAHPALKILYLTGYSDRLFEQRNLLWEDEAFLDKPVTVRGLLEAVSLLLDERIPPPRAPRTNASGVRVRFANDEAEIVTLSVTGALLYTPQERTVESEWPVAFELPSANVRVTGRVVRCEPLESSAGVPEQTRYAVAVAFVRPPSPVIRALEHACQLLSELETKPFGAGSPGGPGTTAKG
jgi:CheY-like chemotaxis protein